MAPSKKESETYAVHATVGDKRVIMTVSKNRGLYQIYLAVSFVRKHRDNHTEKTHYTGHRVAWKDFNSLVRQAVYGTLRPLLKERDGIRGRQASIYVDEVNEKP